MQTRHSISKLFHAVLPWSQMHRAFVSKPLEAMQASPVGRSSEYGVYGSEDAKQARRESRVSGRRAAFSDIQA